MKALRFGFVTDPFVFPNTPNTNSVSIALANYNSSSIALTTSQVEEVSNYITDDVRRSITSDVRVFSVTPVNVTMTASVTPYNESVRDSVTSAVRNYLRKIEPGKTITFDDLEQSVKSNSIAKTFTIQSAHKGNTTVTSLAFTLDLSDDDNPVAEVAKINATGITLVSGE